MNSEPETQTKRSHFNDLSDILAVIRRRSNLIIWTTVIITVLSLVVSLFLITPKYSSTTEILVNRKQDSTNITNGAQIQADVQMINTYKDIITSPAILDEVSQKITYQGHHLTSNELKNDINISSQQNSQVFSLQVESNNPELSAAIANTTAQVFKHRVRKIMSVNNVSILSKAISNSHPVSPNVLLDTIVGLIVGLLLGLIMAFLFNSLDRTVDNERFITDVVGLNDLGMVNEIPANKIKKEIMQQHHVHSHSNVHPGSYRRV